MRLKILKSSSNTFHLSFHLPAYNRLFIDFVTSLKKGLLKLSTHTYYPGSLEETQEIAAPSWQDLHISHSPRGFLQNNQQMSAKLYLSMLKALEVSKTDKGLDLFSGIGVSSLLLARQAKRVLSIEKNPHCHKIALKNALDNKINNVDFRCEDVYSSSLKPTFSWALVNPPREGLKPSLLPFLAQLPKIAYISCDPNTLSRDLKALKQLKSYKIQTLQAFDMFPQTTHLETLVLLKRQ